MKMRLHLLTVFLSLFALQVFAQSFAPVGATWNYINCSITTPPNCNCSKSNAPFTVRGDTMINGKSLKILEASNSEVYVYEDSNRIYVFESDSLYLQMDLNLSEGDTLRHIYTENTSSDLSPFNLTCQCVGRSHVEFYSVVQKDTTIDIDGNQLKRLLFDSYVLDSSSGSLTYYYSFSFTERIGAEYSESQGLGGFGKLINIFGTPVKGCLLGFCCDNGLLCYEDNELSYDYSAKSSDCIYTSLAEVEKVIIQTYPNPASSIWHIQSEKSGLLEIYALSGKKMLRKNIQSGTEQINVGQFAEGIYFYKISSGNGTVLKSGKLVKKGE